MIYMMEWICKSCKHLGDRCDCSSNYCDGYAKIELIKDENMQDIMIRAANKAKLTRNLLLDTLYEEGVLAVYNLGMKHMYEYLEDKWGNE